MIARARRPSVWATTALVLLSFASVALQASPTIPPLSGRVVDQANMIDPATEASITQQLSAHEAATSNQLVVLTVPDLQGYADAEFALEVARRWRLGQAELDNGVLLLVAKQERKIRIEVGYGLEGDLPDALAKRIIQAEITPAFKQGNFDRGISAGATAIVAAIEGSYTPPERKKSGGNADSPLIPMGFIGLFGMASLLQGRVKRQTLNGVVGGSFIGAMIGLASKQWYFGVLAALGIGYLLSRAKPGSGGGGGMSGYGGSHRSGGFGGGGGGFGGGGGGFGGGGASGGW